MMVDSKGVYTHSLSNCGSLKAAGRHYPHVLVYAPVTPPWFPNPHFEIK